MFSVENVMDLSGLAGSAVGIIQSETIHNKEVRETQKRHEEVLALATAQHEKDMKVAKQTYLMSAFTSLEQHFQVRFEPLTNDQLIGIIDPNPTLLNLSSVSNLMRT